MKVTATDLRRYYKLYGIRHKKIRKKLKPLNLESPVRRLQAAKLRATVLSRMREGYSIIFLDEAVFTAKHTTETCWQPPGRTGFFRLPAIDGRCVASLAAIELREGRVLHRETLTAFQHTDVI